MGICGVFVRFRDPFGGLGRRSARCKVRVMNVRRATCSCGQLCVVCEGEPVRISVCHCLACQQRTGSVFAAQARWPSDRVRIEGKQTEWVRTGDAGSQAKFHFCPTCGATVYYEIDDMPGIVAVPVGAFADPSFPPPIISVYEERMHSWVTMPAHIEHMA